MPPAPCLGCPLLPRFRRLTLRNSSALASAATHGRGRIRRIAARGARAISPTRTTASTRFGRDARWMRVPSRSNSSLLGCDLRDVCWPHQADCAQVHRRQGAPKAICEWRREQVDLHHRRHPEASQPLPPVHPVARRAPLRTSYVAAASVRCHWTRCSGDTRRAQYQGVAACGRVS